MTALKKNQDLVFYLLSRASSVLALQIIASAIVFRALELKMGISGIGQLGLVATAASLVTAIPLGQLVDRLTRRRAILVSYAAVAAFTVAIALFKEMNSSGLLVTAAVVAILRNFRSVSQFSVFGDLIKDKANPGKWVNISTLSWQIAAFVGPLAAGFVAERLQLPYFHSNGSQICFAVAAGFLILALGFVGQIELKISGPKTKAPISELGAFFAKNNKIRASLVLDFVVVLFSGATAVLPFLHPSFSDPMQLGILRAAIPCGVILGTILILNLSLSKVWVQSLLVATVGYAAMHLMISISTSFAATFVLLMLAGIFDAISLSVREALLQQETPARLKGRVSALNSFIANASEELSEWESGVATQFMGVAASLRFGAGVTFLACGYFGLKVSKSCPVVHVATSPGPLA